MKSFFEKIDFTFGSEQSDIKPSKINISENQDLTSKLKGNTFAYKSPPRTNTSFYAITVPLTDEEIFEVKRYIWNEDKYDLYFIIEEQNNKPVTALFYAKTDPHRDDNKIASFRGDENDTELIEKIGKWKFKSGAFWLSYSNFLSKLKQKRTRVDKKLIEQLKDLKKRLEPELKPIAPNYNEIVQALIDRTLFIKFLEDNHIINSYFYKYHFPARFKNNYIDFGYKTLLKEHDRANINKLYDKINDIFNTVLFKTPPIDDKFLTDEVLNLINDAISQKDWDTGQLSLFDFRFDVLPIEFISHIYEVFLEGKQADEGIYYTPEKLAHLIVDDTIKSPGTVLDPACGSGMFLILAFRKILEFKPRKAGKVDDGKVDDIIEHKSKLLKKHIYGIEKEKAAWRLTVFSLYLEVLKDIDPDDLKNYIKEQLENRSEQAIITYDFSENILCQNALEIDKTQKAHQSMQFDYIVGNPPFLEITASDDEISFINYFELAIDDKTLKAKNIIGHKQISQAFMIKLKDWAKSETRFGFVQNSSNFYNEKSARFQNFFFNFYQVENFYELSQVKKLLFRKPKESVVVIIFNNKPIENNTFSYYPVDLELFSEVFDLLIIHEDKKIDLKQEKVLNKEIVLRNYLVGNEFDLGLLRKLSNQKTLHDFLLEDREYNSFEGLKRISNKELEKHLKNKNYNFNELNKNERLIKHAEFAKEKYLSDKKSEYYNIPYIYQPKNKIRAFNFFAVDGYINIRDVSKENFQRTRNLLIYKGENIILNRFGQKIQACYVPTDLFFSNLIYGIKLQNKEYYHLFTAILNSDLVNFYLSNKFRKRIDDNFPNLDTNAIKNIPIPKHIDEELAEEISEISKQLTEGKLKYEGETKEKLNDLIFDLYDLNILEKDRIRLFFEPQRKVEDNDLKKYKKALKQSIELFFTSRLEIETYRGINLPFGMVVTAIYFDKKDKPTGEKTLQYIINKILQENPKEKFIAMREKIYGENCIYIVKDNAYHSWSKVKAFEDGQEILKRLCR